MSGDDIGCFGVHVPQGRRGASRLELNDVLVSLVIPVQVAQRAVDSIALARPRIHLHGFHVFDVYAANEWNAFPLAPLFIRIHSYESRLLFGI